MAADGSYLLYQVKTDGIRNGNFLNGTRRSYVAQRITAMRSFFMDFKNRNMKEALKELEHIEEWLNSLGQGWNYFGHVDRAKQRLKNAITLIKNAV